MCTSLLYLDAAKRAYLGRTLELSIELPYQISFFPKSLPLFSSIDGFSPLSWNVQYPFLAITMPATAPVPGKLGDATDLKVIEGMNSVGLTFSVQSYPDAAGSAPEAEPKCNVLSAIDLGAWVLSQFSNVDEVKAALTGLKVIPDAVPILGGLRMPFHYAVHDASGKSIVIEFHHGVREIYDNPVGVMTNSPQFPWHLTNLNNYTFLTNIDHSKAKFGNYEAAQFGSGIAKIGLPATDTSVDRFIRAVFYAAFAEKQVDPEKSVQMVAHIMNNFDRPRGITVDSPNQGSDHLNIQDHALTGIPTEFTSWTSISDLEGKRFFVRGSDGMNYTSFDIQALCQDLDAFKTVPMTHVLSSSYSSLSKLVGR
ncbi:linear amide C-N hydrolase [Paraburkholderia sp. Ac-20342]|uniref:linear amide C-N hydrolase n=1 Tax=Paraburkholderia sp. Ac-20342 TaxID=2703889 RepID=UPI001981E132|nr:linear amide C-N hydrolase [Paraburkholderia sp. Ac-20342]MBN3846947.1 linear amide C-N hydrolase [Paraburkholderia sp. Ac-20342]